MVTDYSTGGRRRGPLFWRAAALVILMAVAGSVWAQAAQDWSSEFADAMKNGSFDLKFRYRYEFVDGDEAAKEANASTLRTRLVYTSAPFRDVFLTINMDDLRPVIGRDFNDTRNGKSQYAVVADPRGTDLNLASLTWTGLENGTLVLGRQRIARGNLRMVGNVGWRQNEQTYDSLSFAYRPIERLDVFYAYVDRVKRVFGPNAGSPPADFRSNSHLLDAGYTLSPLLKLFGYIYLLDFDNAASLSSQTVGLRATGSYEFGDGPQLDYAAEFASQSDYKDNPVNYDANYYVLEGGLGWERLGVKLGYEVLEGDGSAGTAFQTPLATAHAFNGWADRFLGTPAGGLEDAYLEGSAKWLKGTWKLIYHEFSANVGSADYGNELDFVASWKLQENYSVLVKFASYSSDAPACTPSTLWTCDVDKFWVMLTADF